jgi:hypothetical protein
MSPVARQFDTRLWLVGLLLVLVFAMGDGCADYVLGPNGPDQQRWKDSTERSKRR